jgi:hypothetical protein
MSNAKKLLNYFDVRLNRFASEDSKFSMGFATNLLNEIKRSINSVDYANMQWIAALVVVFMKTKSFVAFLTLSVDADVKLRKIYEKIWDSTKINSSNSWP